MRRRDRFLAAVLLSNIAGVALAAPDTVFINGKVVTVNPKSEIVQAVAVEGDKITGVGTTAVIRAMAGPNTKVVDLGGKTMLPGFNDNHIHLGGLLQDWKFGGMIDKLPEYLKDSNTIPKVVAAIKGQAAKQPKGTWIVGEIAREEWPNGTLPTLKDLDEAAPDHPVALGRGPHTLLVNTKALEAAKVTRDTKPAGGEIVRDAAGNPTGKVLESARRVIWDAMPKGVRDGAETDDQRLEAWRGLLTQLESLGITSVNVAGIERRELHLVDELYRRWGDTLPRMVVQLRVYPGFDRHDDPEVGVRQSIADIEAVKANKAVFSHPKLKVGAIKMSIDGGLSAPIMWTTKEYENRPGFHGEIRIPESAFYRVAKRAQELDWQIGIHTMGDGAVVMVTDQIERIQKELPKPGLRHYLHHVAAPPPEATMRKMAAQNIMVASQPGFLLSLGSYADEALGPEDEAHQDPSRSLLNHGIRVSYGSDAGPYGPISALYASVTRRGWNGVVHGPEERVTPAEAIRMHTLEPAYFTFDEKVKGSIEPGKLADLVVLDADPLTIDPERIQDIKVERTVIGGKDIFVRGATASAD